MDSPWHFWIDVGGTFTDCIARRPDGTLARRKLLSSGVTKGVVSAESRADAIFDAARKDDPRQFWRGFTLRLLDGSGRAHDAGKVVHFDAAEGRLALAAPMDLQPQPGSPYELISDEEAPIVAIRYLMGLEREQPIPPLILRLGTTRGTNALITRTGAPTALVTTRGFGDILHIGYQNRPKLFELAIRKPLPLFSAVVEVDERVAYDGEVLAPLDEAAVRFQLAELKQANIESVAICLLHASQQPAHEARVTRIAREIGFSEVVASHEVAGLSKIVPRGDTTVIDAYLNPVLRSYLRSISKPLAGSDVRALTSSGGLVAAERFRGKDSILSGPAGGLVGYSRVAAAAGYTRAIGFDMGGTSTDVSRFDGRPELEYESEKAGVRVAAPVLAIETVAAGGGSICRFDGVKLVVGPDSAGAEPGPACYGRGGPLSITDVNLFLGRIVPERFPMPLNRHAVERHLDRVCQVVAAATGRRMSRVELAEGFVRVANANMARALRSISVAKGCDPRDYVLVPIGGAAGQHACALAEELSIREILFHPDAGLLSALGAGLADHVRYQFMPIDRTLARLGPDEMAVRFRELERRALADLQADFPFEPDVTDRAALRRALDLRYTGVETALSIEEPDGGDYAAAFQQEHNRVYGYVQVDRPIEVVSARVEAVLHSTAMLERSAAVAGVEIQARRTTTACFAGAMHETAVFYSDELSAGDRLTGPAIVVQQHSTVVLEAGWQAHVLSGGELVATYGHRNRNHFAALQPRETNSQASLSAATCADADPVQLEIFNNHFAGIAEQMGIALQKTAVSVNVKERLDFSCAIFTADGALVVNAPHIPVHLGAMGETVRGIIADNPAMRPGDVFVTNDPYRGGSHLPDVTVITPVFVGSGKRPFSFAASRAHHAEIGGIAPGSMPPFSRNLAEEGVVIRNFKLIDAGQPRFDELREILLGGPYPSRAVGDNLADIAAQVAANQQGSGRLLSLAERFGASNLEAFMRRLNEAADQKLRSALSRFAPGRYAFADHLDDGSPICVAVDISNGGMRIDFSGTGGVLASNFNANPAIARAAVMYVLRTLIDEDIPLNDGVLSSVRINIPECLLNPPSHADPGNCAAVAAGNVETSQRIVDALLGALSVAAASQGTMNNVLFGDGAFGYYETICGGAGATADAPGADAVHTHMTNTRLTDPELLERRFPVRLLEFRVRRGSGGAGAHRGGSGVVRRLQFLRPLTVSIVSQRRGPYAPYGLNGGAPGALGANMLTRADGTVERLAAVAQVEVATGDILTIETPGGGGYGWIAK